VGDSERQKVWRMSFKRLSRYHHHHHHHQHHPSLQYSFPQVVHKQKMSWRRWLMLKKGHGSGKMKGN